MTTVLILVAVQIVISIMLILWVRTKVAAFLDDSESIDKVRREIGALIVELDGSADRNVTILEERIKELRGCLADADKRIGMLSNEKSRISALAVMDRPPKLQTPPSNALAIDQQSMTGSRQRSNESSSTADQGSVPFIRFSGSANQGRLGFSAKVLDLHGRGFSSDIIAARLGATIAEVDLAIAAGATGPLGSGNR
jgi:hypothetical protein